MPFLMVCFLSNHIFEDSFRSIQNSVFLSAVILLLNTFGTQRAGLSLDKNKDLAQVEIAMEFFKFLELR
jgi:hypothetical protein